MMTLLLILSTSALVLGGVVAVIGGLMHNSDKPGHED